MKLGFGKKLVLFLHWLMSLLFCALAVALCLWTEPAKELLRSFDRVIAGYGDIIGIAGLAIYVLLAVLSIVFIFSDKRRRGERGFITVDSNESGRTRIAIGAVEQMIRQAVRGVDGIVEMKCGIVNCEDAITINAAVSIASGAHVPTVTMNIQRAVRSYIELNCGVAVREVCVSVNALAGNDENGKDRRKAFTPAPMAVPVSEIVQAPVENIQPVEEEIAEPAEAAETEPEGAAEESEVTE